MKRRSILLWIGSGLSILALAGYVYASCISSEPLLNYTSGYLTNMAGTLGGNIKASFWKASSSGAGASNNSGGFLAPSILTASGANWMVSGADWGNAVANGCPGTTLSRTALKVDYSPGGNSAGQYILESVKWDPTNSRYSFDNITNGNGGSANVMQPVPIPGLTITASAKQSDGSYDITVSWTPMSTTTLHGFFDSDPGYNIITGVAIYYMQSSGTPTTYDVTQWKLAAGGPNSQIGYTSWGASGSDAGGPLTVNVPVAASGNATYLAMSLLFDAATPGILDTGTNGSASSGALTDTTKNWGISIWANGALVVAGAGYGITDNDAQDIAFTPPTLSGSSLAYTVYNANYLRQSAFVGSPSVAIGPTPSGVFAGFDAKLAMGTVTATWRSNAESGLAFYQVYASKLVGGPYVPINGTLTSPMGDSHVYTASFPFPKEIGKRKVFLKVKATDTDGTEWWTQPVKVARRTAP